MMAGHRWLIPPVQGLLLCLLAPQFRLQDSLAAAEYNTAAKTMVMATKNVAEATKNTSVVAAATRNTSVATKNALVVAATTKKVSLVAVATKNTSVATKNALVVAATTKKASLLAVATKNTSVATQNTSVATQNATVVVITKNAMVVAATKNAAGTATANNTSVAPRNTLVVAKATKNTLAATRNALVVTTATKDTSAATKNALVVATATKDTSAATKNALVVVTATKSPSAAAKNAVVMAATTKKASAATKNTSVVAVTKNATVVATANNISEATSNASVVATNISMNGVEETTLTCQSFQCSGERCYQDEAHANGTITCQNETYCELYRFSGTNYTAGCSSRCSTELCRTNASVSRQQCALECCASPLCLQLNASAYGDLPPTTVPPTTTTTTTPRPPPQNGKVCAAFSCHGDGCFKGRTTVTRCILGQDFCEMKKMGLDYMAGCSKACKAAKPVCAVGMKAACYQECCQATPKASCLKLDGKVHVNSAGEVTLAPFLKVMACGVVLLLNYRVSASLWG